MNTAIVKKICTIVGIGAPVVGALADAAGKVIDVKKK